MEKDLKSMKRLYKQAKVAYYELDEPIMTDAQFNKLEDQIKAIEPSWKELHKTGVRTVEAKSEVELARFMPSLEKAYPEDVPRFTKRAAGKRHLTASVVNPRHWSLAGTVSLVATCRI
jgi:NAD-dependent DNA ligase